MSIFKKKKIGIDFGSCNTRVYVDGEGLVFNEPTVVLVDVNRGNVVAIGNAARELLGKTPQYLEIKKPIQNGVISSRKAVVAILKFLIDYVSGTFRMIKPDLYIAVPSGITSVERRAMVQVCFDAGAGNVKIYPSVVLSAIGCGLPIYKSHGNVIVHTGGGTTETAVLSMNGIVVEDAIRVGGIAVNDSLTNLIRRQFALFVGESTVEELKKNICSCVPVDKPRSAEISGRDITTGLPRTIRVDTNDLVEAVKQPISSIIASIKGVLEKTPPELSSDIADTGIALTGGNANLWNIDVLLTKAIGVPFFVVEDPMFSVIKGLECVIEENYVFEMVEK